MSSVSRLRTRSAREQAPAQPRVGRHQRVRQSGPEPLEAVQSERVEQRLLVGEVAARGGVADADLARQLAQRQLAAAGERALGRRQQRGAEVPVVVGAGSRSHDGKRTASS